MTLDTIRKGVRNPGKAGRYLAQEVRLRSMDAALRTFLPSHRELFERNVKPRDEYLLVVLDACRYDVFREVGHLFLSGDLSPAYTPVRDTFEYVQTMWRGESDVTYVSGAVPINSVKKSDWTDTDAGLYDGYNPSEHIADIVDAWKMGWDDDLGTVPPEAVADIVLDHDDEDRLIAHFFQPHAPYIGENQLLGYTGEDHRPHRGNPNDARIWERVKRGEISDRELRAAYRSNLLRALRSVRELVERTRHDTVLVTADHGEALGEYGTYAHPRSATHHPKVHVVPFLEVDADA
ncbi:MAG: hypothetical protein SVW02_01215 [Candidatus Nanohaloarchaea archaeon]|nr:hypothetical protein [Candidatus Nanohaloarchaea archaeon]